MLSSTLNHLKSAFLAERPALFTFLCCITPWCIILLIFSKLYILLHFLGTLIVFSGLGYIILKATPSPLRAEYLFSFSPSIGFVIAGSVIALSVRQGISPIIIFWLVASVGLIGFLFFFKEIISLRDDGISNGLAFIFLSTLVCCVYFLPGVVRDGVVTKDGGFNWIHVDTQYMTALAASVKSGLVPPRMPGFLFAELKYHFGPYAISGAMSAATGIELGDAVVRVVRGTSQAILFLSISGLGLVLGKISGTGKLAGLFAVIGLFFYGSLTSLFDNYKSSSSFISGALLFEIPYVHVQSFGGPFTHILLGHSVLYGMIGLSAILGVFLLKVQESDKYRFAPDIFLLIPGFLVSVNSVAGLGATGIVASTIVIFGYKHARAWFCSLITVMIMVIVYKVMGFADAELSSMMGLNSQILSVWFPIFVWFFFGLGVRVFGFSWLRNCKNPVCWILLISTIGFGLFSILVRDAYWGDNRYGFEFLQGLLSIFGFTALAIQLEIDKGGITIFRSSFLKFMSIIYLSFGILFIIPIILFGLKTANEIPKNTYYYIYIAILLIFSSAILFYTASKNLVFNKIVFFLMLAMYSFGSMAWVTPWVNYGIGRMKMDIIISPGEYKGLQRFREISNPGELFATNRHSVRSIRDRPERSYSYATLSERSVLLEGWRYGELFHPLFKEIKYENDILFQTNEPIKGKIIIDKYNIRYLICEPYTDISYSSSLPDWLELISETGSLKIYKVLKEH